jgi:hypothetical protein
MSSFPSLLNFFERRSYKSIEVMIRPPVMVAFPFMRPAATAARERMRAAGSGPVLDDPFAARVAGAGDQFLAGTAGAIARS